MKVNVALIVNKMCENNLNQGRLAKGAGISVSTVSTMLRNFTAWKNWSNEALRFWGK